MGEGSGEGTLPPPQKETWSLYNRKSLFLQLVWAAGACSHSMCAHLYSSAAATIKLPNWPSYIHVNIKRPGNITGRHRREACGYAVVRTILGAMYFLWRPVNYSCPI